MNVSFTVVSLALLSIIGVLLLLGLSNSAKSRAFES